MELNDVFGADKFGSAGWVGDGCGWEEPNPSGSPAGREIHPEGDPGWINGVQWGWLRCQMLPTGSEVQDAEGYRDA